jgi:hypothetical protein
MRLNRRPLQTRFRYGSPTRVNLATHHNSQAHSSKGTPSHQHPKGCDALTACKHTVSGTISRPLTGVLFTFPSRYSSAIGHQGVFRLTRWSWQIHTRFHEPRATRETPNGDNKISPTGLSPTTVDHPRSFGYPVIFSLHTQTAAQAQMLPQPHTRNARRLSHAHGLASSPFAHHYSGNHSCFLFLRVLRCFTSPRYHQPPYTFRRRQHPITGARFPHSETPGSTLGCQLPGAYRRLPRPSSAPDAKASTVCPQKLEHNKNLQDARVHYAVLKTRTTTTPTTTKPPNTTTNVEDQARYDGQNSSARDNPTHHTEQWTESRRPESQT